jgi:hypothetical protein
MASISVGSTRLLFHIIPYHIITYHIISYHIISYHIIPYPLILHPTNTRTCFDILISYARSKLYKAQTNYQIEKNFSP